jgi:small subunit ribosomal protein S18
MYQTRDKNRRRKSSIQKHFSPRKKVCRFCEKDIKDIDYKRVDILRRYIPERGKIAPRRVTGTCARHQRKLTIAIKRARTLALIPYLSD